jgi:radical SAM superfamily enzyme YgiQ (UPF0313 family)
MNQLIKKYHIKNDELSKNVVIICCPWLFQNQVEFKSQNLGLAYVGNFIKECGHNILKYIDPMMFGGEDVKQKIECNNYNIYRFGHGDEWIIDKIPDNVDYIFINAPFTDSRLALYPLCNKIKKVMPHIRIVIGGILATSSPLEVIRNCGIDIVVKGEGEIASARILREDNLSEIPGIAYKIGIDVVENDGLAEKVYDINCLPGLSDVSFIPIGEYIKWSPRGNRADITLSYITSRGCPFSCNFCSVPTNKQALRELDTDRVIHEIDFFIDEYKINHLEIEDDNFTFNHDHSRPIVNHIAELRENGVDISLSFPNGVMIYSLDKDDILGFKKAGVEIVYLPVESGDIKNLILMNKPYAFEHLDKSLEVARWCKEVGIESGAFFIIGYPGGRVKSFKYRDFILSHYKNDIIDYNDDSLLVMGEDQKSFEKTFQFMKKIKAQGVSFITPLIATPYPSTNLYNVCSENSWFRHEDDINRIVTISYQDLKEEFINISTPWCSNSDIYDRWQMVRDNFDIKNNVIKEK